MKHPNCSFSPLHALIPISEIQIVKDSLHFSWISHHFLAGTYYFNNWRENDCLHKNILVHMCEYLMGLNCVQNPIVVLCYVGINTWKKQFYGSILQYRGVFLRGKVMSHRANKLQMPFLANSIYSSDHFLERSINSCDNQINSCWY